MKKTLFAAKVFGLLAMLPIVVILEMNHVPGSSTGNNSSVAKEKAEQTSISLPEKQIDRMVSKTWGIWVEIIF